MSPQVFDGTSFLWSTAGGHRTPTLRDCLPICSMTASAAESDLRAGRGSRPFSESRQYSVMAA